MNHRNISKTVYLLSGFLSCAAFGVAGVVVEGETPGAMEIVIDR